MKKVCFILAAVFLLSVSCSMNEGTYGIETTPYGYSYVPNEDPYEFGDVGDETNCFLHGMLNETKYDNMSFDMLKDTYSLSGDTLMECRLVNHNKGHCFYCYCTPFIEKFENGKWVRYCNRNEIDVKFDSQYYYCGNDDEPDSEVSIRFGLAFEDISPEMTAGHYRLIAFTPLRTFYAEFDVTE